MPNRGDQIVKQYMKRTRFFVPGHDLLAAARTMAVRAREVHVNGKPDKGVVKQIHNRLEHYVNGGLVVFHIGDDGAPGYRKATKDESDHFKEVRRRKAGHIHPKAMRRRPATRKRRMRPVAA